jgi:predicted MFS family arabinose efflux permease
MSALTADRTSDQARELLEQPAASGKPAVSPRLVATLAFAVGLIAANIYYSQPLLRDMATALHTTRATIGLSVTATQIAFAVGLVVVVPAGDLLGRRKLLSGLLVIDAAGLTLLGLAPSAPIAFAACVIVGVANVAAQLIVPLAASMADPAERGRVTASVISGLLTGILLARTVSGLVASVFGWRVLYIAAAVAMIGLLALLLRVLPHQRRAAVKATYRQTLASTWGMFLGSRTLQLRAVYGGLGFAAFSAFWTTVVFLLGDHHYGYGSGVVGLFALLGAAGALAANRTGHVVDRGHQRIVTLCAALLIAASFGVLALGSNILVALILGTVLMDIGVQALHVANQHVIYGLAPDAPSRVNSSYMTVYFIGGAIGSAVGAIAYTSGGWYGVCVFGAALGVIALLLRLVLDSNR